MYSKVYSAGIYGIEAQVIDVEADVSLGLPCFNMVGFLASEVKEARERVRISIQNAGFSFPAKRITVNLSPADLRKDGSGFDLPIAIALFAAFGVISQDYLEETIITGELGLDGTVSGVKGVLSMAILAKNKGFKRIILPEENAREAAMVEGIEVIGARSLVDIVSFFRGERTLKPTKPENWAMLRQNETSGMDFSDIRGQKMCKRAIEIAVSGGHNILLIGAPGIGKTAIAKRIPGIMPSLTREESLELTQIYSVSGLLNKDVPIICNRQFRAPHHSVTQAALLGGGREPMPGEITLSHNSVLFLDELTEYPMSVLEALREPLEEGKITISRLGRSYVFPARMMLVAAMNPCKCGYFPDMRRCRCSNTEIRRYLSKLSEPLLDRIDICVEMEREIPMYENQRGEASQTIRERIEETREIQRERYREEDFETNRELEGKNLEKYCELTGETRNIFREIIDTHMLSVRSSQRLLKVARTIADMDHSEIITENHILEAATYKVINKKYWGENLYE
ncbi:YifB family Mg chelatase-like AAA ATPase [Eubacterium xylanophilum]|uniref:YifB family Mg chelatase-like AAA ATPase n=1 Tax=Eubacterium xylanophilum TaxID=39497 RepID=UPI00047CBACF|nr:YifB family Mg chelatase-like AAA ATPase [Eubacterium xylanophilum]